MTEDPGRLTPSRAYHRVAPRRPRRSLGRRILDILWRILKVMLLAGAALGPSVPPPPPPPPQTIEAKAEDSDGEDET